QATEQCRRFADLLDQEQQSLLNQDMAALQALIDAKAPLILTLNEAEQAINTHLQQLGRPASASLGDFILSLNDPHLSAQHTAFLDAAQACQNANLRNARLI